MSNEATLETLQKILPGLVIFSDALNHALDDRPASATAAASRHIFRHNDLEHLESLLPRLFRASRRPS